MSGISPRYEFRLIAPDLSGFASAVREQAQSDRYGESLETYLLIPRRDDLNLKVRGGALELKRLQCRYRGLEQWRPELRVELPAAGEDLEAGLAGLSAASGPLFDEGRWDARRLVRRFVEPDVGASAVNLFKQRHKLVLEPIGAELVELWVNGARLSSTALEAEDPEAVLTWLERLGMTDQPNVNYVLGIERVLGQAPLPEGVFYNAGLV